MTIKPFFTLFTILLFMAACEKDNDQTNTTENIDAKGTWSMISITNSNGPIYSASNTDYPCLSNNKLVFNEGGTGSLSYTGADTCYISRSTNPPYIVGTPGPAAPLTWSQSGNKVLITYRNVQKVTVELLTLNSKPVLIYRDTITILSNRIFVATYSK